MRRSRITYAKCHGCRQRVRSGAGSYCWACSSCWGCCRCCVTVPVALPLPRAVPAPRVGVGRRAA